MGEDMAINSNATAVEALVITLGLDPKQYLKAKAEVERKNKEFRDSSRKQGQEIANALTDVAKAAAGLFIGFETARAGLSWLVGLNTGAAQLGRFSKNLGESVHEIQAWDNAVELAGGSVKDADADLDSLSKTITDLRATGSVSPLLLFLQRMGVSIYDAQGRVRKLTDIYKDLGDSLQKYNRADAFNLAQSAGLSESTFNLIRAEANERQRLLDIGEQNARLTEKQTEDAGEAQAQWKNLRQEIDNAGRSVNDEFAPAIQFILKFAASAALVVANRIHAIGDALGAVAAAGVAAAKGHFGDARAILRDLGAQNDARKAAEDAQIKKIWDGIQKPAGKAEPSRVEPPRGTTLQSVTPVEQQGEVRNNNPGNIRYAGQASATGADSRGFAIFPNLATGIREANRQLDLYASRGTNTIAKIVKAWAPPNENDTAAYIARVAAAVGKGANEELTPADRQKLLQAIFNKGEGNKVAAGSIAGAVNSGPLATARFAGSAVAPTAPSATIAQRTASSTKVDIDNINIYTQATDAQGIAATVPEALKRKGVVAQADSGMS